MRRYRRVFWMLPMFACLLAGGATIGCKAGGSVKIGTPAPPPPPPPPPDQDGDGIVDPNDKCVTEKEDGNPPDPNDGCPNLDMDSDGIAIPTDLCPDKPEVVNEYQDEDGCPDEKPIVELKEKEVRINQKIMFKKDKATIEPESNVVVEAVAKVLKENPEVQLIEVGGHASKEGSEWYNRDLTQKRVDAVVKALIGLGVEKERLMAQGYGFYCQVDSGEDEAALEKNRRVEFKILYRKGADLQQERGCEAATKAGIKVKALPALKPFGEGDKKEVAAAAPGKAGAAPAAAKAAPGTPPALGTTPPPAAPGAAAAPAAAAPAPAAPAAPANPPASK